MQSKAREGEKIRMPDSNNNSDENSETNENNDSSAEVDDDSRFVFVKIVPDDAPALNQNILERNKRGDDVATKTEFERSCAN